MECSPPDVQGPLGSAAWTDTGRTRAYVDRSGTRARCSGRRIDRVSAGAGTQSGSHDHLLPAQLRRVSSRTARAVAIGAARVTRAYRVVRVYRRAWNVRDDRQAPRAVEREVQAGNGRFRQGVRRGDVCAAAARHEPAVSRYAQSAICLFLSDEQTSWRGAQLVLRGFRSPGINDARARDDRATLL